MGLPGRRPRRDHVIEALWLRRIKEYFKSTALVDWHSVADHVLNGHQGPGFKGPYQTRGSNKGWDILLTSKSVFPLNQTFI